MRNRLTDKIAVITGAASGIGAASARRFVDEGAKVVVADVQAELGRTVAAELGDSARFVECDVTDERAVAAAIDLAVVTWGRLDVMFNNAGVVGAIGPIADTDSDAWRRSIDILLNSVFYGCKHAARAMVAQGSGSIISTSSIAGVVGGLGPHGYTAAKAAVIGLTKSVAAELGPRGVRCNAIAPGTVPTALTAEVMTGDPGNLAAVAEQSRQRYGKASDAIDIANAAVYLASDDAGFVNGHTLVVDYGRSIDGGSTRFASSEATMMDIARA
jgi:NAD(P)-dependent dehydrogenase (short-subunit alcohol dehydrogenase family)